jgi:hypothetical protein
MTKYIVTSGDSYVVEADSPEEAEALYMITQGFMAGSDYAYLITDEKLDSVEFLEATTIVDEY